MVGVGEPLPLLWGVVGWGGFLVSFLFRGGFWAVFWSFWVLFGYCSVMVLLELVPYVLAVLQEMPPSSAR